MSQQEFSQPRRREEEQVEELPQAQKAEQVESVDELLNDIDEILETNATAFVAGFVQKGGQ